MGKIQFFPKVEDSYFVRFLMENNTGAGIVILIRISDGIAASVFCELMKRMRILKNEMVGGVFFSRQRQQFLVAKQKSLVLFSFCTLSWLVITCVSHRRIGVN